MIKIFIGTSDIEDNWIEKVYLYSLFKNTKEELDIIKTIIKDYDYKLYNINCKNYKNIYSTFCKILINSELSIFYRPLQFENVLPWEESNINNNEGWLRYVFPCLYKD